MAKGVALQLVIIYFTVRLTITLYYTSSLAYEVDPEIWTGA